MKKNFFKLLVAALIAGGSMLNGAGAFAQTPITPLDPDDYQDGVEKFIGSVVPGTGEIRVFPNVGFVFQEEAAGYKFTTYALTTGSYYDISNVYLSASLDTLFVSVNFRPLSDAPLGDLLDELVISAVDASGQAVTPWTLPIRGSVIPTEVSPNGLIFWDPLYSGDSDTLSLTITTVNQRLDQFTYTFGKGANSAFSIVNTVQTPGIPVSTIELDVKFTAPSEPLGTVIEDVLTIKHNSYSGQEFEVELRGTVATLVAKPDVLEFGRIKIGSTETLSLTVHTEDPLTDITIDDSRFSYAIVGEDPNDFVINVTFAPDVVGMYNAGLTLTSATDNLEIPIYAMAGGEPTITFDPSIYNFGYVPVGSTKFSDRIMIVLDIPYTTFLTDPGAVSIVGGNYFHIETIQPSPWAERPDTVYVVVSFTPGIIANYTGFLEATADYVGTEYIELRGNSIAPTAPSQAPQQATAISATEAADAPTLSVREGDIVISGAPAGGSIQVYNLQGVTLKTQEVASNEEVLKTASLPKSVYVVLVNDRKQVVLRQKVLL